MEKDILIIANGDIYKTENGKDYKRGNALYDNVVKFISQKLWRKKYGKDKSFNCTQ